MYSVAATSTPVGVASRPTSAKKARTATVVRATQIIVLDKGVAVERGTHQQLCAKPDSKYAYFMRHQLVGEDTK